MSDSSGGHLTIPKPVADQSQGAFVSSAADLLAIPTIIIPQLLPNGSNEAWYGLNPVGTYSSARTYYRLDLVEFNGASYVALRVSAVGLPSDDGVNWQLVADSGGNIPPAVVQSPINFAFGDASQIAYSPSVDVLITSISVIVDTAFNGVNSVIRLGTIGSPDLFETSIYCDVNETGEYEIPVNEILNFGTDIHLVIILGSGCTQGNGKILINAVALS